MLKIAQLERVEPEAAATPPSSAWGTRQRFFVGMAILVAGLTWAGYLYVVRPQRMDVQKFPPRLTYEFWRYLCLGIDSPLASVDVWYAAQSHVYRQWMTAAIVVCLVGLLVAAGSFLLGRLRKPPLDNGS